MIITLTAHEDYTMNILLVITTLLTTPAGNVAPNVETFKVDSMGQCIQLSSEVQRLAMADGKKMFTDCQSPVAMSDL